VLVVIVAFVIVLISEVEVVVGFILVPLSISSSAINGKYKGH
jgi:hypothetical protein